MTTADPVLTDRLRDIAIKPATTSGAGAPTQSLRDYVENAVNNYFQHLEGQDVTNVYEMVLSEVETPLLEVVMK